MKVFIVSHDLGHNSLGRAVVLAQVFGRRHEVEIVGSCFSPDIWYPARDIGFTYRKVDGELFLPQYTRLMERLLEKLKGDLVIAVKPRPTSFGLALMHRELTNKSVVVDIDDDEMAFYRDDDWRVWDRKTLLRRPNSPLYISMLEQMIPTADAVMAASRSLQERHGGHYLPHVKDPDFLDPAKYHREEERQKRDIPLDEKLIVFAGSPRPHKGLETLLEVIGQLGRDDVRLVVAGSTNDPQDAYERQLRDIGGENLCMFRQISMLELPSFLAMADLVVLPQRDTPEAQAQMPSKLFDAMSMALPIIATGVSDIPEVLSDGCGVVIPPNGGGEMCRAIDEILASPDWAREMGGRARERLIKQYSLNSAQTTVDEILEHARKSRKKRKQSRRQWP